MSVRQAMTRSTPSVALVATRAPSGRLDCTVNSTGALSGWPRAPRAGGTGPLTIRMMRSSPTTMRATSLVRCGGTTAALIACGLRLSATTPTNVPSGAFRRRDRIRLGSPSGPDGAGTPMIIRSSSCAAWARKYAWSPTWAGTPSRPLVQPSALTIQARARALRSTKFSASAIGASVALPSRACRRWSSSRVWSTELSTLWICAA